MLEFYHYAGSRTPPVLRFRIQFLKHCFCGSSSVLKSVSGRTVPRVPVLVHICPLTKCVFLEDMLDLQSLRGTCSQLVKEMGWTSTGICPQLWQRRMGLL